MQKEVIFPFFVGCERSGTTLVRAMFDTHPEMAIPGESYFIIPMGRHRGRYERRTGFATERFISDLIKSSHLRRWQLPAEAVRKALTGTEPKSVAGAIRRVYQLYAHIRNKTRYGDKTPAYVGHLPFLARFFPEARFIHIIRDARDVALSMQEIGMRQGPRRYQNLGECAFHWKERVELGRKAGQRLGAKRYAEVHYEHLIEDPERTVKSLCAFLHLQFHDTMLRYFEKAEKWVTDFTDPATQRHLFLPPTGNLRNWRSQMAQADVLLFDALVGDLLGELGYEKGQKKSVRSNRLCTIRKAVVPWMRYMGHRARRRLTQGV